jgi:uncharacterized protein (TIGR03000 family)
VYSIVMVAAMTAGPEMPDFCCNNSAPACGCYGYSYSQGCCNYGGGYGKACCFPGICNAFCNALSCLLCCGKGGGYGGGYGYGYGTGYGTCGNPYTAVAQNAAEVNTRAEVIVRVPANAKLIANGQPTELTGEQRVFETPSLTPGHEFKYNLAIEINVEGKTKTIAKQITVRAGHRTVVDFTERASSEITVNLPAKARLTVDGVDTRMTGGKHTFKTPELTKGQPFSYIFRAEIDRNGGTEIVSQEVKFTAGEPVNVDFTDATASTK